jgi:hypothetical protein
MTDAQVKFFNGSHRLLPTSIKMEGFRAAEVPVSTNPRFSGTSHWCLESLIQIVPRSARGALDEIEKIRYEIAESGDRIQYL